MTVKELLNPEPAAQISTQHNVQDADCIPEVIDDASNHSIESERMVVCSEGAHHTSDSPLSNITTPDLLLPLTPTLHPFPATHTHHLRNHSRPHQPSSIFSSSLPSSQSSPIPNHTTLPQNQTSQSSFWTNDELATLIQSRRDKHLGWKEVAKFLPRRNHRSCRLKWFHLMKGVKPLRPGDRKAR